MKINLSLFKISSSIISLLVMVDILTFTLVSNAVENKKVTADCRTIPDVADNSTVKISPVDDEPSSGVIISKKGNIYTVLTVAHGVKSQDILDYNPLKIQSRYDEYNVIAGQLLDEGVKSLDLAIIRFESSKNYIPIIFGSSQQTQKWDKVTILGYPITSTNRTGQPQIYPLETTLIEINANRGKGYDMSYAGNGWEGMSGGAIINDCGRLLGIHGRGDSLGTIKNEESNEEMSLRGPFAAGIPIDYFVNLLPLPNLKISEIAINIKPNFNSLISEDVQKSFIDLGLSELESNNLGSAISYFTQAIQKDSKNHLAYSYRGLSYSLIGDKQQAIKDYSRAIELNSNLSNARYNRGLILSRDLKKYDEALRDFEELIKRNPRDADALFERGNIYFQKGNKQQALNDYTTAIRLNKQLGDAFYNRGIIYHQKKKNEQALEDLRRARDIFASQENLKKFGRANDAIMDIQGGVKK